MAGQSSENTLAGALGHTLTPARRNLLIAAALLMSAGFTFSSYGGSVATPAKLAAIGGSDYYALCSALSTMGMMLAPPLVGRLSALFGPKPLALAGMAFQFAMRVGCMLAAGPVTFIVATALSNVGAGLYLSLPYVFISGLVAEAARPKYYGFITTCNALGALAGPLLVGWVTDKGHAGLGFVIYLPLSLAAVVLLAALYPGAGKAKAVGTAGNVAEKPRFDLAGILLLVAGVCCIVLWLSLGGKAFAWASPVGVILPLGGIVALGLLVRVEGRHPSPSVPLGLFKNGRFRTAFLCMFLMTSYSTCMAGFCIYYTQQVMGVSSQLSATVTMPQTIVQTLCGLVIGRLLAENFARKLRPVALAAPLLTTAATFLLVQLTPTSPMLLIYAASVLGGVAMSIAQTAFTPFFQSGLAPSEYTAAQGLFSFGSNGGSCLFSALAGVILNAGLGYNHIFALACIFNAGALVIGFAGFRMPKPAAARQEI